MSLPLESFHLNFQILYQELYNNEALQWIITSELDLALTQTVELGTYNLFVR